MRVFPNYAALESALALDVNADGAFRVMESFAPAGFICSDCGETVPFPFTSGGTGYGRDDKGAMFCYPCGAKRTAKDMEADGKAYLYLAKRSDAERQERNYSATHKLTDWTGNFEIPIYGVRRGSYNIARTRYDVWFSWRGADWHGVQYGDNTQICHVRRLKGKAK